MPFNERSHGYLNGEHALGKALILLSPATKWKGDIGLGVVRPSVIPSFPKSFPEHNSETISYFQTKLDIFIDQDLNWCLLLFIDV